MTQEIEAIETKVMDAKTRANALVVSNLTEYQAAVQLSLNYKGLEKEIKATFAPIKAKAKAAHDEACAQEKRHLEPVLEIQKIVDSKAMVWYRSEQARQEEERRQKEILAKKQEEDLRLAEAEHLAKNGNKEAAEAVLNRPIAVSVAKMPDPKVSGFSIVKTWDFEITEESSLPREFLCPDLKKIGGVVRALKDKTRIAGVSVFSVDSTRKVAG